MAKPFSLTHQQSNIMGIIQYIKEIKYNIGFIDGNIDSIIKGEPIKVNWLKHTYKDRWFADPFILDVTESEIFVLVEEWYDPINRGRISKLIIDKQTLCLKEITVLLELDTHLSFPAIIRKGKDIYIYPENSEANKLKEYKYHVKEDRLEYSSILADGPLTDAIQTEHEGNKYLLSTKLPDANGKHLGIYKWDNNVQKYIFSEEYIYKDNLGRSAGDFFRFEEKIYRPSQVSIKSYGDAVSIQEVSFSPKEGWRFNEIRRIYSPNPYLNLGFHTFNTYKDLIVVDACGYRRAKLCHFIQTIKNSF